MIMATYFPTSDCWAKPQVACSICGELTKGRMTEGGIRVAVCDDCAEEVEHEAGQLSGDLYEGLNVELRRLFD